MAEITSYQRAKGKCLEYLSFDGDYIKPLSNQEIECLIADVNEAILIQADPEMHNLLTGFSEVLTYRLKMRSISLCNADSCDDYAKKRIPVKENLQRQIVREKKQDQGPKSTIFSTLLKLGGFIWSSKTAMTSAQLFNNGDQPGGSLSNLYSSQSSLNSSTFLNGSAASQKREKSN